MEQKWFTKSYRRNLVDMHITDLDPSFLTKLDPKRYVSLVKKANVQSAMVYANSHVGFCYWPTPIGQMHPGLGGRDFLGEVISGCHEENMDAIVYFTLIYDNWVYDKHPDWRILNEYGTNSRQKSHEKMFSGGRYGMCCPNHPGYRDYVVRQLQDLCRRYEFEGMFLDMTFWPAVCYCPTCQARYQKETGRQMPHTIDWENEEWAAFQKKREEWLAEFAWMATNAVKDMKPQVSVEHQFSPAIAYWKPAVTEAISQASDYAGGDIYGGPAQQSFICKLYHNLTQNEPFEYMTSRCDPTLMFHTNTKPKEALALHNYLTLAHNGAFLIIDAIDPVGTMQPKLYETMGEIFSESQQYEPYVGGILQKDFGIYFSLNAKINPANNGKPVEADNYNYAYPHLQSAMGAAETLRRRHLAADVVSKNNLKELKRCQVLILPDISVLDDEEEAAIKDFVYQGGSLYSSGNPAHAMLQEMLGITPEGITKETFTYMTPTKRRADLFVGVDEGSPLTVNACQHLVKPGKDNQVLATVTLPYSDPADTIHFSSIHSNPPGPQTAYPAILTGSYGAGRIMWCAAAIETIEADGNRQVFADLVKSLAANPLCLVSDAPAAVEFVLFDQPENKRMILNTVNEQERYPFIPVHDLTVSIHMGDKTPKQVLLLPQKTKLDFTMEDGYAKLQLPKLDIFHMVAIEYETN